MIDSLVIAQAKEAYLKTPVAELMFAKPRKWRFDYAFLDWKIALEIDGGLFLKGGGRHNRGASMLKDYEKLNTAACMGWKVIHLTPQQVRRGELTRWLKLATGQST